MPRIPSTTEGLAGLPEQAAEALGNSLPREVWGTGHPKVSLQRSEPVSKESITDTHITLGSPAWGSFGKSDTVLIVPCIKFPWLRVEIPLVVFWNDLVPRCMVDWLGLRLHVYF